MNVNFVIQLYNLFCYNLICSDAGNLKHSCNKKIVSKDKDVWIEVFCTGIRLFLNNRLFNQEMLFKMGDFYGR
jgi:hypothetical protein